MFSGLDRDGRIETGPQGGLTDPILFLTVELAPPTLVLAQMEKILRVNATYQLPPCMPSLELKYQVEFWKEGLGNKVGKSVPSRAGSPPRFNTASCAFLQEAFHGFLTPGSPGWCATPTACAVSRAAGVFSTHSDARGL